MARRKASRYVAVEAESGESEDYDSSVVSEDLAELRVVPRSKSHRELAKEIEERYVGIEEEEEEASEESVLEMRSQANLLPNARSPLLFLLRCKVGKERTICHRIMENAKNSPKTQDIFSVVHKEGLKGFLYVEAFKKQSVEDCLAGINNVSKRRLAVVPVQEMVEALTYHTDFTPQEFARIKSGKYKGDIVHVLDVQESVVKVKAIPRLDTTGEYQERRQRPPQRLFNPAEHRCLKRDGGYYFNRDFYQNGYLIKNVLWQNLDFDADPSFAELEVLDIRRRFNLDDTVEVKQGDLRGTVGQIREVSGNVALVESNGDRYEVPVNDLEKHCQVGAEMSYNGQNGIVLHVKDGQAVLGINNLTEELFCRLDELKPPVAEPKMIPEERKQPIRVRRNALINKPVVVSGGRYRGHQGVVKDVHRGKCRVQLSSTTECVTVDIGLVVVDARREVREVPTAHSGAAIEDFGASMSTFGATPKTPGYRTPGYATPGYRTPGYATPGYKPANEAMGSNQAHSKFAGTLLLSGGGPLRVIDLKNDKFIMEDGKEISVSSAIYCAPEKYDHVIVLAGPKLGIEGALITLDGPNCTVRTQSGEMHGVDIKDLSKKVSPVGALY